MKMKKENLMPTVVLGVICLVVAAMLALVNGFTAPVIEQAAYERQQASLREVMPDAASFEEMKDLTLTGAVRTVYRDTAGGGYVLLLETSSQYTGSEAMGITVAVSPAGVITGIKLTSYSESKDFGKATYPGTYTGKDAAGVATADLVAGVTYSSTALRTALTDALATLADNGLTEGGAAHE